MTQLPKHLHIIGICGVATSALAIAFHDKGVEVTGSDKGFFPPVSTELEKHGISFYAGWHPEKMVESGVPDAIMVGTASGSQNPETAYAKEHDIPLYSYPEMIGAYLVRKNSIVCVGTWGKTSSAALLSHILSEAGLDPSYMFGGVSASHDASAKIADGSWSVLEGDEYKSGPSNPMAKFFHYKPNHLLLTAVSWDHADLYPTEESYFDVFKRLVSGIPRSGLIVANRDNKGVAIALDGYARRSVFYGKSGARYSYKDVRQSTDGLVFTVSYEGTGLTVRSPMIGAFQAENFTGCFAMAREIGIPPEVIIAAIASFKGLKRRLEKRLDGDMAKGGVAVFDDIAHSPEKAVSVLKNIREIYRGKVIAVFEPNIGGREQGAAAKYDHAFKDADIVIIPRLTKLRVAEDGTEAPMEGDELAKTIAKTHVDARYVDDDAELVSLLASEAKKGDVIAFLGSHGFRGMIEETIKKLD